MEQNKTHPEYIQPHVLTRFKILHKIGSGAYGHVWKVEHLKSGKIYALKKIFDAFQNSTDAQRTFRQVCVLRHLSHQNVIKLVDTIRGENNIDIYLVFEYLESDLHSVIRENLLQSTHQKLVIAQIARALLYIHSAEIIHRDMKPSNILINEDCEIKICDFGLVKFLKSLNANHNILTEHVATRWYRSPEMLFGCKDYSKPTDIWSLGCIFAQIMLGKPLFPGNSNLDQLQRVISFTGKPKEQQIGGLHDDQLQPLMDSIEVKPVDFRVLFKNCDQQAVNLIMGMLKLIPDDRLTAKQILQHPFLREFRIRELELLSPEPILCPINDNNKLSIRQYRNIVYQPMKQHSNVFKIQEIRYHRINNLRGRSYERRSNETKSDWASPYAKESSFISRPPYRKHYKPLNDSSLVDKENNTIYISQNGPIAANIYKSVATLTQISTADGLKSKNHIRKRRLRKQQLKY